MADTPKYRMIVNELIRRIRDGTYPPGGKLPGHQKLARQFSVSTITAERALLEMSHLGMIERRERAGSYVLERPQTLSRVYVIVEHEISRTTLQLQDYWRGILNVAQGQKVGVQIVQADDPHLDATVGLGGFTGQGLVLLGQVSQRIAQTAARASIPCLYLGVVYGSGMFCVVEDRRSAARELVSAMIADGARRIAFVGNLAAPNHRMARDGYVEGIRELSLGHRYIRDADQTTISAVVRELLAEEDIDSLVVMGASLPVAALPIVLACPRKPKLGCLAENSTILHLSDVAYIAAYGQIETGQLAFETLTQIAAGQLTDPAVRYSSFDIVRPGETSHRQVAK